MSIHGYEKLRFVFGEDHGAVVLTLHIELED